jgi:hypothetical protein
VSADTTGKSLRTDIDDQFVRGLFLVNGGGIVVLLAFVQAIRVRPDSGESFDPATAGIIRGVLYGMIPLLVGLVLAALAPALRRRVSLRYDIGGSIQPWERLSWGSQFLSLACFVLGVGVVISSLLRHLPG